MNNADVYTIRDEDGLVTGFNDAADLDLGVNGAPTVNGIAAVIGNGWDIFDPIFLDGYTAYLLDEAGVLEPYDNFVVKYRHEDIYLYVKAE